MSYMLSEVYKAKLTFVLTHQASPRDIRMHYSQHQELYKSWYGDLSDDKIELMGENGSRILSLYSQDEIIELLSARIRQFDKQLNILMMVKSMKDDLDMELDELADLFARNIAAVDAIQEVL